MGSIKRMPLDHVNPLNNNTTLLIQMVSSNYMHYKTSVAHTGRWHTWLDNFSDAAATLLSTQMNKDESNQAPDKINAIKIKPQGKQA